MVFIYSFTLLTIPAMYRKCVKHLTEDLTIYSKSKTTLLCGNIQQKQV